MRIDAKKLSLVLLMCLATKQVSAQSCQNLFDSPRTAVDRSAEELKQKIIELEPLVESELGRGPGGLYMPFCFQASKILHRLLSERSDLNVVMVGTSINDFAHFLLIVPNYYKKGSHLYIDPTIQQFASNFVTPKIFVGSAEELKVYSRDRGTLEYFPKFVEDYLALKNHPSSPLAPFSAEP